MCVDLWRRGVCSASGRERKRKLPGNNSISSIDAFASRKCVFGWSSCFDHQVLSMNEINEKKKLKVCSPPIGTISAITVTIIHIIVNDQAWCGPWRFNKHWLHVDLCRPPSSERESEWEIAEIETKKKKKRKKKEKKIGNNERLKATLHTSYVHSDRTT